MSYSRFIIKDDFERYGIKPGQAIPPNYLQVELTDKCNLRCASCPRAVTPSSQDILSLHAFERLLDEVASVKHVSFVGGGEALLVNNFADYVQLCSNRNIFSSCNTNGILIEKRLPAAIKAGLGKIAISVDAAEAALLSDLRSGLSISRLENSIRCAIEMTRGTSTTVSAAVTLSALNVNYFVDILNFLVSSGCRDVTVESLHHWGDDKSLNHLSLFHSDADQVVRKIEQGLEVALEHDLHLQIFDYTRLRRPQEYKSLHCPWPWDSMMITCKGDVTPCCVNLEAAEFNRMGNILTESPISIWTGSRYQGLRESFLRETEWPMCVDCVYRMQFGQIKEKI